MAVSFMSWASRVFWVSPEGHFHETGIETDNIGRFCCFFLSVTYKNIEKNKKTNAGTGIIPQTCFYFLFTLVDTHTNNKGVCVFRDWITYTEHADYIVRSSGV